MDRLLALSADSRSQVVGAVQSIENCQDPDSVQQAVNTLVLAGENRENLAAQATTLDVSQLPGGEMAVRALNQAWTDSANADQAYAAWGQDMVTGGCSPGDAPHDTNWQTGNDESASATADKQDFVADWNPIASRYGLQDRSAANL